MVRDFSWHRPIRLKGMGTEVVGDDGRFGPAVATTTSSARLIWCGFAGSSFQDGTRSKPTQPGRVACVEMLDSQEAARRLGVKIPTLYSYVSRGLISAHRSPDSRRLTFSLDEIEDRARRLRRANHAGVRVASITTSVSELRDDGPWYRGVSAAVLATSARFEEVADLLWRSEPGPWLPVEPVVELVSASDLAARDRVRLAVVLTGAHDPFRADLRPDAVVRAARRIIATAVASLSNTSVSDGSTFDTTSVFTAELVDRIGATTVTDGLRRAVNAILVLHADHEIAPSTLAVRVAATTRADCYDAVLSGLGTISGPLHGGASDVARRLLEDSVQHGVDRALGDALRWQGALPGFGHTDYTDGDPRFQVLRPFFDSVADDSQKALLDSVLVRAQAQRLPPPNVDLAIGAIALAAGLAPDAGETLVTLARVAGWIAHYLEELNEVPRRIRARSVYFQDPGSSLSAGQDSSPGFWVDATDWKAAGTQLEEVVDHDVSRTSDGEVRERRGVAH